MPLIHILQPNIANQIAAGEVVERPASVVKELVENAIDAGSTAISVEIENGGMRSIRVTDNGCGIPKEECQIAFLRHATSKITAIEDLSHIATLGFRGEALASIASVSRVTMHTRTAEADTGTRLVMENGEVISQSEAACVYGTAILVEALFASVPARLKFILFWSRGWILDPAKRSFTVNFRISKWFISLVQRIYWTNMSKYASCRFGIIH